MSAQEAQIAQRNQSPLVNERAQIGDLSATRYMWFPLRDYNFMNPEGLGLRCGYVEQFHPDTGERIAPAIPRCALVPIRNIEVMDADPKDLYTPKSGPARLIPVEKYAAQIVDDLMTAFGAEGATEIKEFVGWEEDAAFEIFRILQPIAWKVARLADELEAPARERIAGAHLDPEMARIADSVRRTLRVGAVKALAQAREITGTTNREMAAYVGSKKGKFTPDALDLYYYDQLDQEPPAAIAPRGNTSLEDLVRLMAERQLQEPATPPTTPIVPDEDIRAELEREREARRALEEKVNAILSGTGGSATAPVSQISDTPPAAAPPAGRRKQGAEK